VLLQASGPSSAWLCVAPSDLVGLLGNSTDAPKELLQQLKSPGTLQPDYWALLSVIDLADVLLWSYVDAPDGEGSREEGQWLPREVTKLGCSTIPTKYHSGGSTRVCLFHCRLLMGWYMWACYEMVALPCCWVE
jgi:hypothetical protein